MGTFDVIIIGGGLAGLCAAVEAGEEGADVLLLEKESDVGGSSVLSGRYMAFAGTDMQQDQGIQDTKESLVRDMLEVGKGENDEKLVKAYGDFQLETYHWLVQHGVKFLSLQAVSGHSVPRGHTIDSEQAITTLYNRLQQLSNVKILHKAPALRLEKDANGKVAVVKYQYQGKQVRAFAKKGIILTSGGFSRSKDLLRQFAPNLSRAIPIGGQGNTGDGIKMAWEHGAWVRDIPYLSGTYGFHPSAEGPIKSQGLAFYKGAIIVNHQGKRFVNESISYKFIGNAALQQQEDTTFQIWDQQVMDQSIPGDKLFDFENLAKLDLIHQADSLDELAEKINIPKEELKKTVDAYNEGIKNNSDPLGRKTLTHNYGEPTPINQPPYYAFETKVAMLATYAGLAVNPKAEVVNPFGEPIPGLYAAGEVAGGFHGAGYMTGSSLGKAAIFGRVATQAALNKQTVTEI